MVIDAVVEDEVPIVVHVVDLEGEDFTVAGCLVARAARIDVPDHRVAGDVQEYGLAARGHVAAARDQGVVAIEPGDEVEIERCQTTGHIEAAVDDLMRGDVEVARAGVVVEAGHVIVVFVADEAGRKRRRVHMAELLFLDLAAECQCLSRGRDLRIERDRQRGGGLVVVTVCERVGKGVVAARGGRTSVGVGAVLVDGEGPENADYGERASGRGIVEIAVGARNPRDLAAVGARVVRTGVGVANEVARRRIGEHVAGPNGAGAQQLIVVRRERPVVLEEHLVREVESCSDVGVFVEVDDLGAQS